MRKPLMIAAALALLAAAGIPAMCHAMGERGDTAAQNEEAATSAAAAEAPLPVDESKTPATGVIKEASPSPIPPGAPSSFADLAEGLLPAVVNISSTQKAGTTTHGGLEELLPGVPDFPPSSPEEFLEQFLNRRGDSGSEPVIPPASLGSGFVINAEKGLIVTNNHVVKNAEEVRVTLHDNTTIPAKVLGTDEKTDIAILEVETDKKLTDLKFGDSDHLRVGDWVIAIGNPFGLGGTVTAGIVSAQQRNINAGPYDNFIQTDASINRGNSGGPMFNLAGEVIGINTAIYSPSGGSVGIGFAIPSNMAKSVINQLIEYGRTRRGWIGVRIQVVTEEIAQSLALDTPRGALVASVTEDGPAAKAKLKAGDIILSFNGRPVEEMRQLPRIVAETPIDSKAEIRFWREGKERKTSITVGELEKAEEEGLLDDPSSPETQPSPSRGTPIEEMGMTLGSISETARRNYAIPSDVTGVVVTQVEGRGEAAKQGLSEGDVLVEINQKPVETPQQAAEIFTGAKKEGKPSVLVLTNRQGDVRFLALQFKKTE